MCEHGDVTDQPTQPAAAPIITVDHVSKTFRIPTEQVHTLKERVLHPRRRTTYNEFQALDDVNFAVRSGEFLGIVGRNGSGKSTLLKCLAGIYRSDLGSIFIDGRVSTFIELGVGFNPDLAARENVVINGAMLGLSRREAGRRFDSIIDFAELREFTDLKLKNYSSGMMVRLAFSVVVEVDADILLIDEVLAVGDAAFQQKCFDEFEAIRAANKTVLLVTHDMSAVRRFCDRAILLERGRIVAEGDPEATGNKYLDLNFSAEARAQANAAEVAITAPPTAESTVTGDGRAVIEEAWIEAASGERVAVLSNGDEASFKMRVRFTQQVANPVFSVSFRSGARVPLFAASSDWSNEHSGPFAQGETATWSVHFTNMLGPDRYSISPSVTLEGGAALAVHEQMLSVVVTRVAPGALVDIPFEQQLTRSGEDVEQRPGAQ